MSARLVCKPRTWLTLPVVEIDSFYTDGKGVPRVKVEALFKGRPIGCDFPASDFWVEGVAC